MSHCYKLYSLKSLKSHKLNNIIKSQHKIYITYETV